MKILLVQNQAIIGDKEANFKKIFELTRPFEKEKIDLIILPEVFAVGWFCEVFNKEKEEVASSRTLSFLSSLAQKFNANLVGGSFISKDGAELKNRCLFIDKKGRIVAKYDKLHLFSHYEEGEEKYIKSGKNGVLVNTEFGKIGLSICYDIRFAKLYNLYSDMGAKILVNVAAWPKSRANHWDNLVSARAIENQAFMIAVSQCGEIKNGKMNYGHSKIVSPFGEIIAEMDEKEGASLVEINVSEVDSLRKKVPTLKDRLEEYKIIEV